MRLSRVLLLLAVVGPVAVFLIERLVVTDEEAIRKAIESAAAAVANRDFVALRDALDEEYEADGRDRDEAARYVEEQVRRYAPTRIGVDVERVAVEGETATAAIVVTGRAHFAGRIPVELRLRKRPEGWRITSARQGPVTYR